MGATAGLDSGVGLAVAEVAVDGGPVSGPAVDRAVQLAARSGPGVLLVTGTVGVLLSGSGIELAPTGDADVLRVVG